MKYYSILPQNILIRQREADNFIDCEEIQVFYDFLFARWLASKAGKEGITHVSTVTNTPENQLVNGHWAHPGVAIMFARRVDQSLARKLTHLLCTW